MTDTYLIALGSNRWHHRYGRPRQVLRAVMEELASLGTVSARSPIIATAPMGAAQRRFANAAVLIECEYDPPSMLAGLKRMERKFGRRRGRRWGDRVLDLDIVLWSGGVWDSPGLRVPHVEFCQRDFVLGPACVIARDWKDPVTGKSLAHLAARNRKCTRPKPARRPLLT